MKILVFYYFNYYSGRLSQFHEYARPLTKQTLNWHSVAPSLSYFVDS